jgi:hypothetical protein
MRRRKRKIALILLMMISFTISLMLYLQLRAHESSDFADVSWTEGGTPGVVKVTVKDAAGNPVPGASVDVLNNSGGSRGITNASGVTAITPGEAEFGGLSLNNQTIVRRRYAYILGTPSVNQGLIITVIKKK